MRRSICAVTAALTLTACANPGDGATAFVGARMFDGIALRLSDPVAIVVRNGRIESIEAEAPAGATVVDVSGRYIMPGMVNAHGHVGDVQGLEGGHYTTDNLLRQLRLYARYGITSVVSLGGDGVDGMALRDAQDTTLNRARLYTAGAVVTGDSPAQAITVVDDNVAMGADFIKIRVDDNLGSIQKMSPEVYGAVIERAGEHGKQVASHLYYLDDAKQLLNRGTGFIAHSIRDQPVDTEVMSLMTQRDVCYSPTLMREVSTFVYESEPDFFSDPFFLDAADAAVLDQLRDPARQAAVRRRPSTATYKAALEMAMRNLKALSDGGVRIAFGTDTGPAGRFQGYFEHLELELMQRAGMSPFQVLRAATANPAACLNLEGVGTLAPGQWADFLVLTDDPTADVMNTRSIESVWVAGNEVAR